MLIFKRSTRRVSMSKVSKKNSNKRAKKNQKLSSLLNAPSTKTTTSLSLAGIASRSSVTSAFLSHTRPTASVVSVKTRRLLQSKQTTTFQSASSKNSTKQIHLSSRNLSSRRIKHLRTTKRRARSLSSREKKSYCKTSETRCSKISKQNSP